MVNLSIGMKQYESDENSKYETLGSLFQKTDAFNERGLALFMKLKEGVWQKLEQKSTPSEINFIKRYEQMMQELEVLIRKGEKKVQQKVQKRGEGQPPIILGGQLVNEEEFNDENLCQICCF